MIYKVEVVKKDNLDKIRYITVSYEVPVSMKDLIEVDVFRDVANYLMSKNSTLTYDQAYVQAKEYSKSQEEHVEMPEDVVENTSGEGVSNAKVKLLSINEGIKLSEDTNESQQQGI